MKSNFILIHVLCIFYFYYNKQMHNYPFKDEAQTALFKAPVRTAQ